MEKLKPFAGDDDDEDENSDDGVVRLTEKTFESYVSENSGNCSTCKFKGNSI